MARFVLNFDKSYGVKPETWAKFVKAAEAEGHEVVCVTLRYPEQKIELPCRVIYNCNSSKPKGTAE